MPTPPKKAVPKPTPKRRSSRPRRPLPAALTQTRDTYADLDATTITSTYHWSSDDQAKLLAAIFAAMRVAFEARWVELGLAGVPLPPAAVRHLRELATTTAASAVRSHNTSVSRFIATWLATYASAHGGSTAGARAGLIEATGQWLAARVQSYGAGMASFQTLLAHSLADLYSAGPDALFTVDGPALTDQSCAVCQQWYGAILTPQQAWSYTFPAHPHCEHVLRRLSPDEAARAQARGL